MAQDLLNLRRRPALIKRLLSKLKELPRNPVALFLTIGATNSNGRGQNDC
jgi:hypothetical protein